MPRGVRLRAYRLDVDVCNKSHPYIIIKAALPSLDSAQVQGNLFSAPSSLPPASFTCRHVCIDRYFSHLTVCLALRELCACARMRACLRACAIACVGMYGGDSA